VCKLLTRVAHLTVPGMDVPGRTFSCAVPSGTLVIKVAAQILDRLILEGRAASKKVPRRGLEAGGILLGRMEAYFDVRTCWIEDFLPVDSEYRFGPSYLLSQADLRRLDQAVAINQRRLVGLYRTQTRSETPELETPDVQLLDRCCGPDDGVFLLLLPVSGELRFFMRSEETPASMHEVLADHTTWTPKAPAGGDKPRPEELPIRLDPPVPPLSPEPLSEHPSVFRKSISASLAEATRREYSRAAALVRNRKISWLILTAVGICLLLAIGEIALSNRPGQTKIPDPPPYRAVALRAKREGQFLRVLWDADSPAFRAINHAVLHINDGGHGKDIMLTPSELKEGGMLYIPETSDVDFRLETFRDSASTTESVRIHNAIDNASRVPAAPIALPPIKGMPQRPSPSPSPTQAPPPPAARQDVPAFSVESADTTASVPAETQEIKEQYDPKPEISSVPPPKPPRIPTIQHLTPVSVVAEPVSGSRLGHLVAKVPLLRRLRKSPKTTLPVPTHEVRPSLTIQQERSLTEPVRVDVKVYVAESGKVDDAEVVEYGDPPNFTLAKAALATAHQWSFAPARLGDVPVSSEVILHFRFRPAAEEIGSIAQLP